MTQRRIRAILAVWLLWPDLSPNRRTTADVYVNRRLAMRISRLGWLLRMDPIIEPWAGA